MKQKTLKPKEEIMWAIHGTHGLYVGTDYTRKGMIRTHMADLGYMDWQECRKKGDRAIKVIVIPFV